MREVVFVSHANPEDNIFATWVAAKLAALGYTAWCDTRSLVGGESDFWGEIESTIRNKSAKFLFVLSRDSIIKEGPKRELAIADGLRDRHDFIIPLRIDQTDFRTELPASIVLRNVIDFATGWKEGLARLLTKLEGDRVPRSGSRNASYALRLWARGLSTQSTRLRRRTERYWSNWFTVELPERIYAYGPAPPKPFLGSVSPEYPFVLARACCLSFADPSDFVSMVPQSLSLDDRSIAEVATSDILSSDSGLLRIGQYEIQDPKKKIVELMNNAFRTYLSRLGLIEYAFSQPITAWYFKDYIRASTKYFGRHFKQLSGRRDPYTWHFAIAPSAFLFPFPGYAVSTHVVFTQAGQTVSPQRQHAARRRIARYWYNNDWRDLLLGAMVWLAGNDATKPILLPVGKNTYVTVSTIPIQFTSDLGYDEPATDVTTAE